MLRTRSTLTLIAHTRHTCMYSCTAMHRLTASQLGVRPQPFLPQHIDQQRLDDRRRESRSGAARYVLCFIWRITNEMYSDKRRLNDVSVQGWQRRVVCEHSIHAARELPCHLHLFVGPERIHTCGWDRASPKKASHKITSNRRMIYR